MVNLGVLLANYYIALCFHGIRFKVKTTHRVVAMTTLWTLLWGLICEKEIKI